MKLINYLNKAKVYASELARRANVSNTLISQILSQDKDILLSMAIKISRATNGEVRPEDLITEDVIHRKRKEKKFKPIKEKKPRGNSPRKNKKGLDT